MWQAADRRRRADGRPPAQRTDLNYRAFGFAPYMPKWNTDHPLARQHLQSLPVETALMYAAPGWQELVGQVWAGKLIHLERYAFTYASVHDSQKLAELIATEDGGVYADSAYGYHHTPQHVAR